MNRIVFITGGARSGKSRFALEMATKLQGRKVYIATAEPLDEEMRQRIERHKRERGGDWFTIEEPLNLPQLLRELKRSYDVVLIDCLTLWLSNLILKRQNTEDRAQTIETEIAQFLDTIKIFKSSLHPFTHSPIHLNSSNFCSLFIVSNEVGMGIVPDNELARRFRDLAGLLNQKVATVADEVYIVVSGIPLKIKG
ncbi:MAG: bifunctional adenosylcobinamide kinase/adenosylcobinamide-phosphate guanylyltransferase [Thermodesulfovibrionales bacterium]